MSSHIAYPDELLDDKKLEEFYEKLELTTDNYLEGILNLTLFGVEYSFSKLRKPVNKSDWVTHGRPAIVNAFYSSIENSIRKCQIIKNHFISSGASRVDLALAKILTDPLTIPKLDKSTFTGYFHRIPCWYPTRCFLQ